MHEMSLCEGVLQIVEEHARSAGFSKVTRVRLEIGRLAGVDPRALRFSFGAVTRNTVAEAAELDIIDVDGRAWCMSCQGEVAVTQRFDACPNCGSHQLQVIGGDDLRVKDLEVQ